MYILYEYHYNIYIKRIECPEVLCPVISEGSVIFPHFCASLSMYNAPEVWPYTTTKLFGSQTPVLVIAINTYVTCSTKFCDKLFVKPDIFYHFWGLILCNAKLPWFQLQKKCKGTVHEVFFVLRDYSLRTDGIVVSLFIAQMFFSLRRPSLSFLLLSQ